MNGVQSPFSILTFIVAPAMLTNASCVLALSTINRMLKTRERMRELLVDSAKNPCSAEEEQRCERQVERVEQQALFLMKALAAVYVALGSFALATLVSLLGAAFASLAPRFLSAVAAAGIFLGLVGVSGLVTGCVRLFHATQLSLENIREEAQMIRERQRKRRTEPTLQKSADDGRGDVGTTRSL